MNAEELAKGILSRDANVPDPKVSEKVYVYRGLNNRNYYVRHAPELARAYLDLLGAARAVVYESGEMPAENGHYALLERLAGVAPDDEAEPSYEGKGG